MSYDILYNQVFLKSGNYIVPTLLIGPSNVWTGYRNQSRVRDWTCTFASKGFVSAEKLYELFTDGIKDDSEILKYHNKWMNGKSYKKWVKKHIEKAVSFETFLFANALSSVSAVIRDSNLEIVKQNRIYNNETFENWIHEVNELVSSEKRYYIALEFPREDVYVPDYEIYSYSEEKIFIIKGKHGYISQLHETGVTFSKDKSQAIRFNVQTIYELQAKHRFLLNQVKVLKQETELSKEKFIISFKENDKTFYVYPTIRRKGKRGFSCVENKIVAKQFSETAAKAFVKKYKELMPNVVFEILPV